MTNIIVAIKLEWIQFELSPGFMSALRPIRSRNMWKHSYCYCRSKIWSVYRTCNWDILRKSFRDITILIMSWYLYSNFPWHSSMWFVVTPRIFYHSNRSEQKEKKRRTNWFCGWLHLFQWFSIHKLTKFPSNIISNSVHLQSLISNDQPLLFTNKTKWNNSNKCCILSLYTLAIVCINVFVR